MQSFVTGDLSLGSRGTARSAPLQSADPAQRGTVLEPTSATVVGRFTSSSAHR